MLTDGIRQLREPNTVLHWLEQFRRGKILHNIRERVVQWLQETRRVLAAVAIAERFGVVRARVATTPARMRS